MNNNNPPQRGERKIATEQEGKLAVIDLEIAHIEYRLSVLCEQRRELVNYLGLNKEKQE